MLATIILASLGAFAPAPSPVPTLPPIIVRTVTTETCTTLHQLVRPVGYVSRRNDAAFRAMALSTQKFLGHFMPGDAPTAADLQAALGSTYGSGTPLTALEGSSQTDDSLLYGPQQTLSASRIDAVAQQIFENIILERGIMKKSLSKFPPGRNARVDAMRRLAQNVIDLQYALANRYERFAGTYIDEIGVSGMTANSASDLSAFKVALRALLFGDANGLAADSAGNPSAGNNVEFKSINDLAQAGSTAQVVRTLRAEEFAFARTLVSTFNQCHGTHYIIKSPKPLPSATPAP